MNKIEQVFKDKKAYIGFLTAGDPSLEKTKEYIISMEKAGASIVEIGIPFSDPIAEGSIIQAANVRALSAEGGCTTDMVFDMVKEARKEVSIPLVFLTYLNPVYKYGYDKFFKKCKEVGVNGIIIPDMPYEERPEIEDFAKENDVNIISLVSVSSDDRIEMIVKDARGYIYLLPFKYKENEKDMAINKIKEIVARIKKVTDTPVVISCDVDGDMKPSDISDLADGIIVDNSIVKIIEKYGNDASDKIYEYVKSISK